MNYVDRMLHPGEKIAYRTRLHPLIYLKPVFALLILTVVTGLVPAEFQAFASALLLVIVLPYTLLVSASYVFGDIAVTNQRVLLRMGVLRSQYIEILLHKIEEVDIGAGLLGTFGDCGSLRLYIAGGILRSAAFVRSPEALRDAVIESRDRLRAQRG